MEDVNRMAQCNIVESIGGNFELHLKYEGLNPTCSFKDRGMTMAVSVAKERGARVVICASTGNTSAAAAAYAAKGGLKCVVLLPNGKIAQGKLNKFYKENTLLNQAFVKDSSLTVSKYLEGIKQGLTVSEFRRVVIG